METELNEFLARKGVFFPPYTRPSDYLTINSDELAMMSPEELEQAAFDLAKYAYYLQTVINSFQTKANMCRASIKRLVGHKLKHYNIYGSEEKWLAAIADNEHARKWRDLEDKAKQSVDMMAYVPTRIQDVSQTIRDMLYSRRRSHGKI